jgi:hypothetical protein
MSFFQRPFVRGFGKLALAGGTAFEFDRRVLASSLHRNSRTVWAALATTVGSRGGPPLSSLHIARRAHTFINHTHIAAQQYDYKVIATIWPERTGEIHERVANRYVPPLKLFAATRSTTSLRAALATACEDAPARHRARSLSTLSCAPRDGVNASVASTSIGRSLYARRRRLHHRHPNSRPRRFSFTRVVSSHVHLRLAHTIHFASFVALIRPRVLRVCQANQGLYIKLGQSIAAMNHVLPVGGASSFLFVLLAGFEMSRRRTSHNMIFLFARRCVCVQPQYNQVFAVLQDQAPTVPYADVVGVFMSEFGEPPEEVFQYFEKEPIASASIAQVHRATTHAGAEVAVKVQKPFVARQLPFDLFTYKVGSTTLSLLSIIFLCRVATTNTHLCNSFVPYQVLINVFERAFDLPMVWTEEYTARHLRQEVNFLVEGRNAERAADDLRAAGRWGKVYIPRVLWPQTTERVLTAEWVDGVKLNNPEGIRGMGLSVSEAMQTTIETFAHQIFHTGFLHCDPVRGASRCIVL